MKNSNKALIKKKQKEYYKKHPFADTIIIFIHGILEGSRQFRSLGNLAYKEGYSVLILLLPGHGKTGGEFAKANLREWVDYVNKHVREMEREYRHIILVGHSMGSLLAAEYVAYFPDKIEKLILLALPVGIHIKFRVIKGAIKIVRGKISKEEPYVEAEYKAIGVGNTRLLTYLRWVPRYLELFILIIHTRKQLIKIKKPVLVIQSKKDEFIPIQMINFIKQELDEAKIMILNESGHFCYHHTDINKIERGIKEFIQENE